MDTLKKIRRSIPGIGGGSSGANTSTSGNVTITCGTPPAPTAGAASGSGGARYEGGSGGKWIHPPDVLMNGSVTYTLKLVGTREVSKPRGAEVIQDAIYVINLQNQQRRAETSHAAAKLQKVDLRINIDSVTVLEALTKVVLFKYPLGRISFCSDDKQDKRYLAFIANDGDSSHSTCLVFLSDKMAEQITLTIGEAFDLSYKRYMDKHKLQLQNQKEVLKLRCRIAQLEDENIRLAQLLADATKRSSNGNSTMSDRQQYGFHHYHTQHYSEPPAPLPPVTPLLSSSPLHSQPISVVHSTLIDSPIPIIPSSPIPSGPPPSLTSTSTSACFLPPPSALLLGGPTAESSGILPSSLIPPLYSAPEKPSPPVHGASPLSVPNGPTCGDRAGTNDPSIPRPLPPPVVPRRQTAPPARPPKLQPAKPEPPTVFDDDFDPRAHEKSEGQQPTKTRKSAAEYSKELDKVEEELQKLDGLEHGGGLEISSSDVFGEMPVILCDESSEYGTPLNTVDPKTLEAVKKATG